MRTAFDAAAPARSCEAPGVPPGKLPQSPRTITRGDWRAESRILTGALRLMLNLDPLIHERRASC